MIKRYVRGRGEKEKPGRKDAKDHKTLLVDDLTKTLEQGTEQIDRRIRTIAKAKLFTGTAIFGIRMPGSSRMKLDEESRPKNAYGGGVRRNEVGNGPLCILTVLHSK